MTPAEQLYGAGSPTSHLACQPGIHRAPTKRRFLAVVGALTDWSIVRSSLSCGQAGELCHECPHTLTVVNVGLGGVKTGNKLQCCIDQGSVEPHRHRYLP